MDKLETLPEARNGELIEAPSSDVGRASAIAREQAELQAAMILARNNPRNEAEAFLKVSKAFSRIGMADACLYSYPRGGQRIEGPSVKCARELARCWRNIRTGLRFVRLTEDTVHIKGYAMDVEANTYVETEDEFQRLVQRKAGKETVWVKPDERDLRELVNRRGAILVRNSILHILPSDLVEEAIKTSRATLKADGEGALGKDRKTVVLGIVKGFDALAVTVTMLEKKLGYSVDLMNSEDYVMLKGIYQSLVDKESRREDHFDLSGQSSGESAATKAQTKAEEAKAKLQQAAGESATK
jgi:hypothetical protein